MQKAKEKGARKTAAKADARAASGSNVPCATRLKTSGATCLTRAVSPLAEARETAHIAR